MDVSVNEDTKQIEIALTRKDGSPDSVAPQLDVHKDPTPELDDDEDSSQPEMFVLKPTFPIS